MEQKQVQITRVNIDCKATGKLLARLSGQGNLSDDFCLWLWCRNCHCEHLITHEDIAKARTTYDTRSARDGSNANHGA